MPTMVKTRLVRIGNSQGIRIPRLLLKQTNLSEEVELELRPDQIVIRSAYQTRHNWEDEFEAMAERGDDKLLDEVAVLPTAWEEEEWEW